MNKNNFFLVGLIFLLLFVIYLIESFLGISFLCILSAVLGLALLLLYKMKNKKISLSVGVYCLYISAGFIFYYIFKNISVWLAELFFAVPAIIFFIIYMREKIKYYIYYSAVLLILSVIVFVIFI